MTYADSINSKYNIKGYGRSKQFQSNPINQLPAMSAELTIKVAIADDHKIFRDGIKMALKGKEYLKILWEAEDGKGP